MSNELATQTAEAVAPESAPVQPEVPVVSEESNAVQEEESAPSQQLEPEVPPEEKQPKAVRELIDQRKKRQKAEQEAAYWRGVAEARAKAEVPQQPVVPVMQPSNTPPTIDQFESYDEYEKARDEYVIIQAQERIRSEYVQHQRISAEENAKKAYRERLEAAAEADPTIMDIAEDDTLPVSKPMAQVIMHSEYAPQVLKWLNNNRKEAAKIAQMHPILAAKELGIIEAQIKYAPKPEPVKRVSSAPAPVQTVNPSASPAAIDEDDLPMKEYYRRRTKATLGR